MRSARSNFAADFLACAGFAIRTERFEKACQIATSEADLIVLCGAWVVLVAVQLFVLGLYLPPVFRRLSLPTPPQTIISLPVHTPV